jgi:Adenylate and Guanylate cyclase catalytic domain/Double zinc ribbon
MRCSKCGAENPDGAKFCIECASPFARRCSSCGKENPPRAKFCLECSKPIDPPPANTREPLKSSLRVSTDADAATLDGERKTVTALFADIKGSTELEQDLDPEEARAIVDPALKLMIDAVRRYDGYIVQSTGDGIFALFGAPVAHEDHPQRALYAALRIQEELKKYSARLREAGNLPIEARVGVNTGEVVVRSIATGGGHLLDRPVDGITGTCHRGFRPGGSARSAQRLRSRLVEWQSSLVRSVRSLVRRISRSCEKKCLRGTGGVSFVWRRAAARATPE